MSIHHCWNCTTLVENLFATPIWVSEFNGDSLDIIQNEIKSVLPKYEDRLAYSWGDGVLTTVNQAKDILIDMPNLKQYIISHIISYTNDKYNINFIKSWANYNKHGGYQNYHHHLIDADLSGVYYYQTNGKDGDIMFKTDSGGLHHSKVFGENTIVRYKPSVGKLILFPSFLEHSVSANNTQSDRVSIAFNCQLNYT